MARNLIKPRLPVFKGSHSLARGLILDLPLYENGGLTTNDRSGKNNDGTLQNGALWQKGIVGPEVSFDGVNDRIDITQNNNLPIWNNSYHTIEFMFKASDITQGGVETRLFSEGNSGNAIQQYSFGLLSSKLRLFGRNDANTVTLDHSSTTVFSSNTLYHVIVTNTNNSWIYYFDGKQDGAAFAATPGTMTFNKTTLACTNRNAQASFFVGQMQLFRAWKRVLTNSEIMQLTANPWVLYKRSLPILGKAPSNIPNRIYYINQAVNRAATY